MSNYVFILILNVVEKLQIYYVKVSLAFYAVPISTQNGRN